ncbi:hypothetical protein SM007_28580 [Streptomyces avermitilis]|uniref:Uncharacterized protein n=1 Tax=Streptomyces avermitilis TaxID=33903 RepID=A0A4D4NA87_STRAX|nr:hypothetical protein SM007_28580 [Streptomyces avermitilis]BBJ47511.1 hypothetical protein SAVMC3_01400 [Streptomyces avermitilis]GDY68965.1 hypothetical protein SAV14893_083580 [Streptomyces avermitilis]GDY70108.1 hypothetical protein SAV14893_095010 [Streptomyces avermitilis]GDY70653.1 hypothetical protein SAV31267_001380 [Streptomyces avermitilis]
MPVVEPPSEPDTHAILSVFTSHVLDMLPWDSQVTFAGVELACRGQVGWVAHRLACVRRAGGCSSPLAGSSPRTLSSSLAF